MDGFSFSHPRMSRSPKVVGLERGQKGLWEVSGKERRWDILVSEWKRVSLENMVGLLTAESLFEV